MKLKPIYAPMSAPGEAVRPPTYYARSTLAFPKSVEYAESIERPSRGRWWHDVALGLTWAALLVFVVWAASQGYVFGGVPS